MEIGRLDLLAGSACQFAVEAGALALDLLREGVVEERKDSSATGDRDIVTEADRRSQEHLRERLRGLTPEFDFVGEEGSDGLERIESDRPTWVVDPVDGTQNFVREGERFCVMIGLCVRGKPVVGVVYEPAARRLYRGVDGMPSVLVTWEGMPGTLMMRAMASCQIAVSRKPSVKEAVATLGLTSKLPYRHAAHAVFGRTLDEAKGVRVIGCAGIAMCQVASGAHEIYLAPRLAVWDALAPSVILRGAGARVTDAAGEGWTARSTSVVASNGSDAIHAWGVKTVGEALAAVAVK